MADSKKGGALMAPGITGTDGNAVFVSGSDMPEVEVGHKGHELNPGDVFDPNAARRKSEGRAPGLQDSEINQPAHWQQPVSAEYAAQAEVDQLEAELKAAKDRLSEAKKG